MDDKLQYVEIPNTSNAINIVTEYEFTGETIFRMEWTVDAAVLVFGQSVDPKNKYSYDTTVTEASSFEVNDCDLAVD